MTNEERAARFREARMKKNLTQAQVYAQTGISSSTLSNLESPTCDRVLSTKTLNKLAEFYEVNSAWLAGQSNSATLDTETQMISEATGLTADSIRILKNLTRDEDDRRLVNEFICSKEFSQLVHTTKALRGRGTGGQIVKGPAVDYSQLMHNADGSDNATMFAENEDAEEYALWKAQRLTERMIRKILNE